MSPLRTASKHRTVPKSFRIDESALLAIEAEAATQNISSNTLVNQILRQYAEYDRFARKLNTVKLSGGTFRGLLTAAPVNDIIDLAKTAGSSIPQAYSTAKTGKVELETLLDHVRSLATYSRVVEFNESISLGGHVVTLTHEFGLNWSIFLVHYLTAMFTQVSLSPKFDMSDRSVIFTLPGR